MPTEPSTGNPSVLLRIAAMDGDMAAVERLLSSAEYFERQSFLEALNEAAERGKVDVVNRLLLKLGGKPGQRALCSAARYSDLDTVNALIPYANPKRDKSLALQKAADGESRPVVRRLIPLSNVGEAGDALIKKAKWEALDLLAQEVGGSWLRQWAVEHSAHLPIATKQMLAEDRQRKAGEVASPMTRNSRPRC